MEYEEVEVNSERWFDLTPLLNEEFRDIKGYENLYQISNYGRVKSLGRFKQNYNCLQKVEEKIRKQFLCKNNGYYMIMLSKNGVHKQYSIHKLVSQTFIPNPNNYPIINHKNENKTDNRMINLEWCSYQYNLTYKNKHHKIRKPIEQYDINNNFIKKWSSATEIEKALNIKRVCIIDCCKGKQKTASGYKWRYSNE